MTEKGHRILNKPMSPFGTKADITTALTNVRFWG
jgi:hypothetical protein